MLQAVTELTSLWTICVYCSHNNALHKHDVYLPKSEYVPAQLSSANNLKCSNLKTDVVVADVSSFIIMIVARLFSLQRGQLMDEALTLPVWPMRSKQTTERKSRSATCCPKHCAASQKKHIVPRTRALIADAQTNHQRLPSSTK